MFIIYLQEIISNLVTNIQELLHPCLYHLCHLQHRKAFKKQGSVSCLFILGTKTVMYYFKGTRQSRKKLGWGKKNHDNLYSTLTGSITSWYKFIFTMAQSLLFIFSEQNHRVFALSSRSSTNLFIISLEDFELLRIPRMNFFLWFSSSMSKISSRSMSTSCGSSVSFS